MLETLDFTFYIGSTPTFLYFDLYLNTAYTQNVRLYFSYRQYTTFNTLPSYTTTQYTSFDLVKYVDDSTTWEILSKDSQSDIPSTVSQCENWASANNMKLNASKTKELRVNFSACPPSFPPIVVNNQPVDIVKHVKLLGVTISNDLKWNLHVDVICTKASKRLYALRLLKRSALPDPVLVNVYSTCVRPILEYACEAWHSCLPTYLSDQLESVQRRGPSNRLS